MKINKKLSTAIVLSLMMGVYGTASADSLYGAESGEVHGVDVIDKGVTTILSNATSYATNFTVTSASGPWDNISGGMTKVGNSYENLVQIKDEGSIVNINVYGGYSENGNAKSNEVTIFGGTFGTIGVSGTGNVYGGYAHNGIAGGYDEENKKSLGNKVTITGGTFGTYATTSEVIGGLGTTGASYNKVELNGANAEVYGQVIGGMSDGAVEQNIVTLTEGAILGYSHAIGGMSSNNNATKNEVTVGSANVQFVYGGRAENGTASENIVNINDWKYASSSGSVYGGLGKIANENNVYLNGGQVYAEVCGGRGDSKASENYVKVAAEVNSQNLIVYGGYSVNGEVSKNVVDVYGKPNSVRGGFSTGSGAVSENVVNLYDGCEVNNVYGGNSDKGDVSGNIINVNGNVKVNYDMVAGKSPNGEANQNIININTAGIVNVKDNLIGGEGSKTSGNTLNVRSSGNKVGGLKGFQIMNFYIPKDADTSTILLTSTNDVKLNGVTVAAGFHNDTALTSGDKVILISAPKVEGMDSPSELKVADTDFTDYDVRVYQADNTKEEVTTGNATTLVAELVNMEINENAKIFLETTMAGATIINDGSDMLAGAGFDSAVNAIAGDLETGAPSGSMSLFGAVSGNKSKIKTGSHVDVKGWNMNLGLAKELKNKDGKMIIGPVVEYGRGDYDSYLDNGYHGEGNSHYVGGGVMAKQINNNGNYFEGSLRAGKLTKEFKSTGGSYDSDAKYMAGHIGVGHIQKMDAKNSMDYYAKFFHTHVSDDDAIVNAKGKKLALDLDSMNSSRLRIGGRLNHAMGKNNAYYFGLAYQREFNGSATGALEGKDIVAPSTKGNTGFMELGVKLFDASKYDLDFGGFGSIGKKKGAGINLSFNYKF